MIRSFKGTLAETILLGSADTKGFSAALVRIVRKKFVQLNNAQRSATSPFRPSTGWKR